MTVRPPLIEATREAVVGTCLASRPPRGAAQAGWGGGGALEELLREAARARRPGGIREAACPQKALGR
eukprot:1299921-Pyramimonas_sp.AAC.1